MKNTLSNVLIFATGAAIGAVVTWKFMRTKYDRLIQEEVDSVKEAFSKRYSDEPTEGEKSDEIEKSKIDAIKEANKERYHQLTMIYGNDKEVEIVDAIRVITPEEFDTIDDYEAVTLTHYADGVITDESDEPMGDTDDILGPDVASHFGEYEEDSVFIRNDELQIDYEILKDNRNYSDIVNTSPYPVED